MSLGCETTLHGSRCGKAKHPGEVSTEYVSSFFVLLLPNTDPNSHFCWPS